MTARVRPDQGPALVVVLPFFMAAPAGLAAAGLLLAGSGADTFVAINLPRTVAVTHAAVIGWLSLTMMGAVYQLGPAVLGGRLLSARLARMQWLVHAIAVPVFIWALLEWRVTIMGLAGVGVVASFALFLANATPAAWFGRSRSLTRAYIAVSLALLAATFVLGLTWVGTLRYLWFPITLGELSAHAHLGLLGWVGLTVMGVSYQLVPMFSVVNRAKPRFGWIALGLTVVGLLTFASLIATDPPPAVRVSLAAFAAAGPLIWAVDMLGLMRARSRRRLDVQGRATFVSIAFLFAAVPLAVGAAGGTPLTPGGEPARWLLAYAFAAVGGWAGTTLIGNSFKIVPFLIWFHRYRPLVGRVPVPLVGDIYSERAANGVLVLHGAGVLVLVTAALFGQLDLLRAGGLLVSAGAAAHMLTFAHMLLPKRSSRPEPIHASRAATS
jgi:hypothetical protein